MRSFIRIIKYTRGYTGYAVSNIVFNVLSVFFSAISLTMIIPFLRLLFNQENLVSEEPTFDWSVQSGIDYFNYILSSIITQYGELEGLFFICCLVVVIFFLKNLFRYLAKFVMAVVRNGVVRDIRAEVFQKVLNLPVAYFTEKRKGDIITRTTSDVQEIEKSIMSMLEVAIRSPINILTFLAVMIYMSPQLTLFVLIMLPLTGFIIGRIGKSLKKTSSEGQQKLGVILSVIEETITGQRIIKAFNAGPLQQEKFQRENDSHYGLMTKMMRRKMLSSPLSEFLGITVVVTVLFFGGRMVLSEDIGLSPENFIGFILIFSQLIPPAKSFSSAYYHIQRGLASAERIEKILDKPVRIRDKPDAKSLSAFTKSIEFQNVDFAYDKERVLQDISLTIKKGQTVAIVGPSGAGKSTLVDLIPRFYDPIAGRVVLDGEDIRNYKLRDLRSFMGIVTQESILFNDTVYNNITFGAQEIKEKDVLQAAKVANAHRFIVNLEQGYQTNIGDQGGKLSGGERQRVAIARAVLKNPPILILDEATSALDTESEQLVQEALTELMKNRTSVVIAHRLSTIQGADKIIVLEDGRIKESGDHNSLLSEEGIYQKLVSLQTFE